MGNSSPVDRDYNLWVLLRQAKDLLTRVRDKELKKYGISTRQAAVLFVIKAIGYRATPAEIARWLVREPHTVSSMLSRMERQGLVTKASDLHRKNIVRVALTEKGEQAYSDSEKRETIRRVSSSLSEKERQQLWSYLETIRNRALKELGTDQQPPFP